MLCVTLQSYSRPCGGVTGGVSNMWVFDPTDFNFTQVAARDPYTVIARRAGATAVGGARMFPINFQAKEAQLKAKQSRTGCSVKYYYDITAQLPDLSNDLTSFLESLDDAGCCCGLGLVLLLNTGKILIVGEKYVNTALIPYFEVVMNGTDLDTGKKFDDFNGANVIFKAEYSRGPREYTGGVASIQAFEAAS